MNQYTSTRIRYDSAVAGTHCGAVAAALCGLAGGGEQHHQETGEGREADGQVEVRGLDDLVPDERRPAPA